MIAKLPLMPPKLEARIAEYKMVLPPFVALYDRVFVYPLDDADQPKVSEGGIIMPEVAREKLGAQRGVVVSWGVKAAEEMTSHGVGLGDIVVLTRFSTWQRPYFAANRWHRVFVVQSGEIAGSEDLKGEFDRGEIWMDLDTETGGVTLHERVRVDPPAMDVGEGI